MANEHIVLAASALLAQLRGDAGATKVGDALSDARMSVVNMAEVASNHYKRGMPDDEVEAMLGPLPIRLTPGNAEVAWEAGRLRLIRVEAGLSLGDRFRLALAKRE